MNAAQEITLHDREVALRRTIVQIAESLEKATKADDNERSLLFHGSLIGKLCRDAEFFNSTAEKVFRDLPDHNEKKDRPQ